MEKNDFSGMQSENVLGNLSAEEIGKLEAYYLEEAEHTLMPREQNEPLEFMMKQMYKMEHLFQKLQFPWEECVPFLYRCFMQYIVLIEEKEKRKYLSNLMTELIKTMNFLSKKQVMIDHLERDYRLQRMQIEALIMMKSNHINGNLS